MLIDSPRLKRGDREAWEDLVRYDEVISRSPRIPVITARAQEDIRIFADQGPCFVSTSWGKDSVVLAHLAATSGVVLPLCWVRVEKWENPDCLAVRDAFLSKYGDCVDYHEYEVEATAPRWWEDGADEASPSRRTSRGGFTLAEREHGKRHISGVRAEESRVRRIAMARWGTIGPYAARPIGNWSAVDIFAYLHKYDLPIHPAYAMSMAGHYDRRWLRVSSLGGIRGAERSRADWEAAYYPEIVSLSR